MRTKKPLGAEIKEAPPKSMSRFSPLRLRRLRRKKIGLRWPQTRRLRP